MRKVPKSDFVMTSLDPDLYRLIAKVAGNEAVPFAVALEVLICWGLERYSGRYFVQGQTPFSDYRGERKERMDAAETQR